MHPKGGKQQIDYLRNQTSKAQFVHRIEFSWLLDSEKAPQTMDLEQNENRKSWHMEKIKFKHLICFMYLPFLHQVC